MPDTLRVRLAESDGRDRVNAFYASQGLSVRVAEGERWVLAERSGRIIGVLRICIEEGHQVLRTVQVAAAHQRQGVGKQMLACAERAFEDAPCFCLPFSYLQDFYGRIGFVAIPIEDAPEHLRERLRGYLAQGRDMIVMRRG
jgi:N-acetylglutamate synthase-like GNAT family acetyltransferase